MVNLRLRSQPTGGLEVTSTSSAPAEGLFLILPVDGGLSASNGQPAL